MIGIIPYLSLFHDRFNGCYISADNSDKEVTILLLSKGLHHVLKIVTNGSGDLVMPFLPWGGLRLSFLIYK